MRFHKKQKIDVPSYGHEVQPLQAGYLPLPGEERGVANALKASLGVKPPRAILKSKYVFFVGFLKLFPCWCET